MPCGLRVGEQGVVEPGLVVLDDLGPFATGHGAIDQRVRDPAGFGQGDELVTLVGPVEEHDTVLPFLHQIENEVVALAVDEAVTPVVVVDRARSQL